MSRSTKKGPFVDPKLLKKLAKVQPDGKTKPLRDQGTAQGFARVVLEIPGDLSVAVRGGEGVGQAGEALAAMPGSRGGWGWAGKGPNPPKYRPAGCRRRPHL